MPIIKNTTYRPTFPFQNPHFNTVYRPLIYKRKFAYNRKRLELSDGDFIDLDISSVQSERAIIAIHGLEGESQSSYIQSLSDFVNYAGIDMIALNLRGCSGEDNRLFQTYHSGKSEDLNSVIEYILTNENYKEIYLVGYSLGGNLVLKYVGERREISSIIKSAVGISVPCDLEATAIKMSSLRNTLYLKMFLNSLIAKLKRKNDAFPNSILDLESIRKIKNFEDFDNVYTAPANGFINANDYWEKCSCKQFIPTINIPSLMITALDDPFFSERCYPFDEATENPNFHLETPRYGGHVGFGRYLGKKHVNWVDQRILTFINKQR